MMCLFVEQLKTPSYDTHLKYCIHLWKNMIVFTKIKIKYLIYNACLFRILLQDANYSFLLGMYDNKSSTLKRLEAMFFFVFLRWEESGLKSGVFLHAWYIKTNWCMIVKLEYGFHICFLNTTLKREVCLFRPL